MKKTTLARVPYYIGVSAFTGMTAFTAFINNTQETGILSDVYLAVLILAAGLCGMSLFYLFSSQVGDDDEVDLEVSGVGIGKATYYMGVLGMIIYRCVVGYEINHTQSGIGAIWGLAWLLSGLVLGVLTYANYKSYVASHPAAKVASP